VPSLLSDALRARLDSVRRGTLRLLDLVDDHAFGAQPDPDFSPIGWHVGHIATFEAHWMLEQCKGAPPRSAEFARLFSPLETPKAQRRDLPPRSVIMEYCAEVRQAVLGYLADVPVSCDHHLLRDARIVRTVLQHECQHSETITIVLQMHEGDRRVRMPLTRRATTPTDMVRVAGGEFQMGRDRHGDWYDNEVPAHRLFLREFLIDVHPVTNAQFAAFIAAGGYDTPDWWTADGWAWRSAGRITAPQYWYWDDGGWSETAHWYPMQR
jgi:iron(II)-dependent oxidoreductase